jgi:hypothetical protein
MGTNLLTQFEPREGLPLSEIHNPPDECVVRFARHFFSPMMVSNLSRPMTPMHFVQFVDPLLTIDLMVGGMTAAMPLSISKQTFNARYVGCTDLSFTEVELIPQIPISVPWIATAFKKLNAFQQWPPNWNDDKAVAFSTETLDTARDVLQKAWTLSAHNSIHTKPNIVPMEDGSVRFEWVNRDKELFLTIFGNTIEAQRWRPLDTVESEMFRTILPGAVESELEWLAA